MSVSWHETTAPASFNDQPIPPYIEGDIWNQGPSGETMRCILSKTAEEAFDEHDWEPANGASKLADDAKESADAAGIAAGAAKDAADEAKNAATAPTYKIVANCSTISQDPSGVCAPSSFSCRSYKAAATTDGTTVESYYAGRLVIDASSDGTTWANVYTATANSSLATKAMSSIVAAVEGCAYVRVTLFAAGGTTEQLAQAVLSVVQATGNHLVETNAGLFVVETGNDPQSGGALRLANDKIEMLKDGNVLMRLAASLMEIGINATSAIIKFCGGKATIRYDSTSGYTIYESTGPVALLANSGSCMIGVSSSGGPAGDYGIGMVGTKAVINGSDLAVNGESWIATKRIRQVKKVSFGRYSGEPAQYYEKTEAISGFLKAPIAITAASSWCTVEDVWEITTTKIRFGLNCIVSTQYMMVSFYLIEFY